MSYGYVAPLTSTFTSNGVSQLINIPGDTVKLEVFDESQFSSGTPANTYMINAYWFRDMANGSAFVCDRTVSANTIALTTMIGTGGFTFVDPTGSQLQAPLTGSAVSKAAPAGVTSTNTGTLQNGDVVRVYGTTGMLQIAGYNFTVSNVSSNASFKLAYLDSTTFANAATAITYQKFNYPPAYYPIRQNIVNVESVGVNSIITLAVDHGYTVGQAVRIYVPTAFGSGTNPFATGGPIGTNSTIQQIVTATIIATGTADASGFTNTITVNINSSGFTFAFPTSAIAVGGVTPPFVEPVGEAATTVAGSVNPQNLLDDRTRNVSAYQMMLGASVVGQSGDTIRWIATRAASV